MKTVLLLLALSVPLAAQTRDNVLLVIGDDFGVDRVGVYAIPGANPASTPVLDAMAAAGVSFSACYSQCLCSSTRVSILTGLQGLRSGIGTSVGWSKTGTYQFDLESMITLPQALRKTHATAAFGKWHISSKVNDQLPNSDGWMHPIASGFDTFFGTAQNVGGSAAPTSVYFSSKWNTADKNGASQQILQGYAPTLIVDATLDWIAEQGNEPWFAWVAFHNAHTPLHAPPPDLTTLTVTDASPGQTLHRAMVEAMDAELGRLLSSIRPSIFAKTWVIFVSDNGDPPSTTIGPSSWPPYFQGKPLPWEGNVRMPLIVVGPDIEQPGRVSTQVTHTVDLLSTVCELAGVPRPDTAVDSISFANILRKPGETTPRKVAYGERFKPNGLGPKNVDDWYVSDGRWKLMFLNTLRFFDLKTDFDEFQNLLTGPPLTAQQQAAFDMLMAERDKILGREQ